MTPEELIKWLIENKLMEMRYDKLLREQTVGITDFGIEVNEILNKLRTDSAEAEETNILAAEKLEEDEKSQ